ncbi:hypothetical protein EJ03DRAFT_66272 [Teratosphaeria nubilosa]|uniref:Uncharacterized protein n=1 Tax=Teratosphaeria nubilosa TaxID=161662 RepID=A0A6G1LDV3_9PEZI|nr:hypothetical protein EJ03DRAFT_66272 [Teratosphaeria nubilosa]
MRREVPWSHYPRPILTFFSRREQRPASDLPLIWIVREARKAGMPLDEDRLEASGLVLHDFRRQSMAPTLLLDGQNLPRSNSKYTIDLPQIRSEADMLRLEIETKLHDSLASGGGMSWMSCLAWKMMEYMPFRRMDLQKDGTWKPIIWPLPMGEVRYMPDDALVHSSIIRRMQADKTYRPGENKVTD